MFIDASAFCAIFLGEAEGADFDTAIGAAAQPLTSAVAVWETVRAIVRQKGLAVTEAAEGLSAYLSASGIEVVSIGATEQTLALEAFDRFGKGRHAAQLNMGDCFAYACARSLGQPLLFKGDDFSRTDIEPAFVG